MQRLDDVLIRQKTHLYFDIAIVLALIVSLGVAAISLGAQL